MIDMNILKELKKLQDKKYAEFCYKLTPTLPKESFIGVRAPEGKKLATSLYKSGEYKDFIKELPHKYYDENMLHSYILSLVKDYDEAIESINDFLPYVDNWATCDTLKPKAFNKNKDKLIKEIKKWLKSSETYTIRFGIEMLMNLYLDDDFDTEYIKLVCQIRNDEYYVKMMQAWYMATALTKKWEESIVYIENNKLDTWTHNKAIQKAIESYRISDERKGYLRSLKIK